MRSLRVLLVLGALLVAGCASPAEEPSGAADASDEPIDAGSVPAAPSPGSLDAAAAAIEAPVWAVGDAWSVVSTNEEGEEERAFLVVTKAEGDSYTVETTSTRTATWDAIFDVSYVGPIRARDLAGTQRGQPIQYYDFPLADGKTWTTTWDGLEVSLKATKAASGFSIVGTADGEPYVEYDYTPALKWFSQLMFVRDGYGLRVDSLESGWTGELATGVAKIVYEGAPAAPVASPNSGAFTVDEGQTSIVAMFRGGGAQYVSNVLFVDPAGQPTAGTFDAEFAGGHQVFETYELPPTPGEWHFSTPGVHDPTGGFWTTIQEVAITTRAFPS